MYLYIPISGCFTYTILYSCFNSLAYYDKYNVNRTLNIDVYVTCFAPRTLTFHLCQEKWRQSARIWDRDTTKSLQAPDR